MLAASWALVHPPWIPTLRLTLRWDIISRSVSQSKTSTSRPRYPSSKTPSVLSRHSHVSQAPVDKLVNLVAEGKYQLAVELRTELSELGVKIPANGVYEGVVEELIRNPRIEDITQEFKNWLALLPDARTPDQNIFRGIRQLLHASPEANLPLIIQFGVACASKGYTILVREEIMPIVARHASAFTYAQFIKDVEAQAQDYHARSELQPPVPPEAVFEDPSDDYNIVNSEATPPPPNVIKLITDNLPEILPKPLPNDAMVFEDESSRDYVSYASTSSPTSLPDVLVQLINDHRYEEAYRFLVEVQDVGGVLIPNSPIYEQAAQAALDSNSALAPQERLAMFTSWMSLIPPTHLTQLPAQFLKLRQLIFRASYPNHVLVARFATILASKGYGDLIIPHAIPLVMRFAPETTSRQFVLDFERAVNAYWMGFKPDEALSRATITKSRIRAIAVKHLTFSNRLETAISLLPKAGDPFHLKPTIYDNLIRSLRSTPSSTSLKQIPLLENLRNQGTRLNNAEIDDVGGKIGTTEIPPDNFVELSPKDFGQNIGRAVLYLRKALASKDNLPDPLALSEWFEHYASSSSKRKRRAITTLRNKALRCGGRSAETYLFSEMHYYQRTGNNDGVIKTFADHFYLIGVPQNDVIGHYHRIKQGLANKYRGEVSPKGSISATYTNNHLNVKLAQRKLWPKHSHTTLVWHALLNLTSSDADAQKLYQKLVQIAATGPDASLDEASPPPPPLGAHHVGPAAFTPFIRKLMVGFGSSRGATVLRDMLKVGLEPTLHQYTELAGLYARLGDTSRAFMVLDKMEANKANLKAGPDAQVSPASDAVPHDRPIGPSFPAPDIVLYTSLLRGFLISRDLQAIDEVDRRLKGFHQYTPGEYPALDKVYAEADRLRSEHGRPHLNDIDD